MNNLSSTGNIHVILGNVKLESSVKKDRRKEEAQDVVTQAKRMCLPGPAAVELVLILTNLKKRKIPAREEAQGHGTRNQNNTLLIEPGVG